MISMKEVRGIEIESSIALAETKIWAIEAKIRSTMESARAEKRGLGGGLRT